MNRDFKGIWIPKEIWLNRSIGAQAKLLWAEIHSLYSNEHGGCYASNEYLCEVMDLQLRRLQDILRELKEANLLEQTSFNGRKRILRAIVPDHIYESDCTADMQKTAPLKNRGAENCTSRVQKTAFPHIVEKKVKRKDIARKHAKHESVLHADFFFCLESRTFKGISSKDLENWKECYPEISLSQEIRKAEEWLKSNSSKAKKKKQWRRFLTSWFDRVNEKAENKKAYRTAQSGTEPSETKERENRIAANKKFSIEKISKIKFNDPDRKIEILEDCVMLKQGKHRMPLGYSEPVDDFKNIIYKALRNWNIPYEVD